MYKLVSIKRVRLFDGTLHEAKQEAWKLNYEYAPAYGVQVKDEEGNTLYDTETEDNIEQWFDGWGEQL